MATWPATLPCVQHNALSYAPKFENVLSSQMEGRTKHRRRFTYVPDVMTFSLKVDRNQLYTLMDFVQNTVKDVEPFDWVEHRKIGKPVCQYRFTKRPTYSNIGLNLWQVDIELDVLTRYVP